MSVIRKTTHYTQDLGRALGEMIAHVEQLTLEECRTRQREATEVNPIEAERVEAMQDGIAMMARNLLARFPEYRPPKEPAA